MDWQWWYSLGEERVYRNQVDEWHYYAVQWQGRRLQGRERFQYGGRAEELPSQLWQVMVNQVHQNIVVLMGYSPPEPSMDEGPSPSATLTEWISNCEDGVRWAVRHFSAEDGGAMVAAAIHQGTAVAVSNGSYKDEFGTAALVLEGEDSVNQVLAVNVVPGDLDDQSSYQSELSGIFRVVMMVQALCNVHAISEGAICIGCNGDTALKHVFGKGMGCDIDVLAADYDMVSAICRALQRSPIQWSY
jgi:hypothetical protein